MRMRGIFSDTAYIIRNTMTEVFVYGKRSRAMKLFLLLSLITSIIFNSIISMAHMKRRILCSHIMHIGGQRQLSEDCATLWQDGTGALTPIEEMFPPISHEPPPYRGGRGIRPTTNVAFMVHYTECPEDHIADHSSSGETTAGGGDLPSDGTTDGTTAGDTAADQSGSSAGDPMNSFLDTAAVQKHAIACAVPSLPDYSDPADGTDGADGTDSETAASSTANSTPKTDHSLREDHADHNAVTMYAVMHPDAVVCVGPSGAEYDRASLLESLGYWVKIWEDPVDEGMLVDQPYLRDNVGDDVGLGDLMPLHALKFTNHEFAVVLDQNFILKSPLDPILDTLRTTDDILAYVTDPQTTGVSTDILILKPDVDTYDDLIDTYLNVPYTPDGGWGDTGIGLYDGGMGTSGLLDYYLNRPVGEVDPSLPPPIPPPPGMEVDRCQYANNADGECKTFPFEDIVGYMMTDDVCGQPWMCTWGTKEETWDEDTQIMCKSFLVNWIQGREEFQTFFFNQPTNSGDGDYHVEVYHGLCSGEGPEGYIPMLDRLLPAQENCINGDLTYHGCETEFSDPSRSEIGSGLYLDVTVTEPQQCQAFMARPNNEGAVVPFGGSAFISGETQPDTSMVFVIDRSGSTCDVFGLECASDENYDLQYDDVLDCEIAAILDLVNKVRDEGTVNYVGLVSFSHKMDDIVSATIELPLTDINIFDANEAHAIENSIRGINCGGATNYAAAVEKACEVIEESSTEHNVVVFISDGEPTRGGAPANYCSNNAVFHTIALGEYSTCSGGDDTSLMDIALATSGTCQEVINIPDIRLVLQEIGEVQFLSIIGSTVASQGSVNFGCADVPNFMTSINIKCPDIGPFCGEFLASDAFANSLGQTGDSACCVCGGGVYLDVGDLDVVGDPEALPPPGFIKSVEYADSAVMHEGTHRVCTTVMAAEAGVPGVNVQCRDILVCPYTEIL